MTVLNNFMGVARSFSHWYHGQERQSTLSEVERTFEAARDKAAAFKREGDDIMESFVTSMDEAVEDIEKQLEELQVIDETF
jgi:tryptophanyl-tRNA synthetase